MPNLYILLGSLVASLALGIGGYVYGRMDGRDIERSKHLDAKAIVDQSRDAMQTAAAEAIANIEVVHKTMRTEVQREVIEKPVYRDCRASDDILRALNAAKTGRPESFSGGELPGTPPAN